MAKGTFKRVGNTAVPVGKEGREALLAIPEGKEFVGEFRTARNPDQHELFWSLCTLVAEATDSSKIAVKEWLLEKCGFVDLVFYPDGSMQVRPKSIAWESMEQQEFNQFFRLAVPKIADLLGNASAEVWQQFEDLLAPDRRAQTMKRFKRTASPSIAPSMSRQRERVG